MPRRDILLDTGPIVGVLDGSDQWHRDSVALFHDVSARCLTTEAVLTEATHLLGRADAGHLPLELLLAADIPIVSLERSGHEHALRLMRRYADVPMDYADATLVVLADALQIDHAFTFDRKGFRNYRRHARGSFRVLPDVRP